MPGAKRRQTAKEDKMSSILTNSSALSALQTLKSIHSNLETVTSQVSSGKRVADAKDNPTVWITLTLDE